MKSKFILYGFLITLVAFMGTSCEDKPEATESKEKESVNDEEKRLTSITFVEEEYDFGTVNEGEKVMHDFTFVNQGENELLIKHASASCGCTVPNWPKEPIAPGDSGVIKVVFNSKNKAGQNNKTVSVYANTDPQVTTVRLKGNVLSSKGPLKSEVE